MFRKSFVTIILSILITGLFINCGESGPDNNGEYYFYGSNDTEMEILRLQDEVLAQYFDEDYERAIQDRLETIYSKRNASGPYLIHVGYGNQEQTGNLSKEKIDQIIKAMIEESGIDVPFELVASIAHHESGGNGIYCEEYYCPYDDDGNPNWNKNGDLGVGLMQVTVPSIVGKSMTENEYQSIKKQLDNEDDKQFDKLMSDLYRKSGNKYILKTSINKDDYGKFYNLIRGTSYTVRDLPAREMRNYTWEEISTDIEKNLRIGLSKLKASWLQMKNKGLTGDGKTDKTENWYSSVRAFNGWLPWNKIYPKIIYNILEKEHNIKADITEEEAKAQAILEGKTIPEKQDDTDNDDSSEDIAEDDSSEDIAEDDSSEDIAEDVDNTDNTETDENEVDLSFIKDELENIKNEDDSSEDIAEDDDPVLEVEELRDVEYRDMLDLSGGSYTQEGWEPYYEDGEWKFRNSNSFRHSISDLWLSPYEVTYELWYEVYQWAIDNGYKFANAGLEGTNYGGGYYPNYDNIGNRPTSRKHEPVTVVNWRDAIVWCNAYSELMGYDPVYYDDRGKLLNDSRYSNKDSCDNAEPDWSANGYRLPTEGEWQYFASEGGDLPWDYASGASDDYINSSATGRVAWYDDYPTSAREDYTGPAVGSDRVSRGGSLFRIAEFLRVGCRYDCRPGIEGYGIGFRVARRP